MTRISAFELCHGRSRFLAYILDGYRKSNDIDVAIGKFVSGISTVEGRFFLLDFSSWTLITISVPLTESFPAIPFQELFVMDCLKSF